MIGRWAWIRLALYILSPLSVLAYVVWSHQSGVPTTRLIGNAAVPVLVTVTAIAVFAVRAYRLRRRRALVPGEILADVRLSEYTFARLAEHSMGVGVGGRAGDFALVPAHGNLEFWTMSRILAVPLSRILVIDAPLGQARSRGSEFEITFEGAEDAPVLVTVLGPWGGLLPPSPAALGKVVDALNSDLAVHG